MQLTGAGLPTAFPAALARPETVEEHEAGERGPTGVPACASSTCMIQTRHNDRSVVKCKMWGMGSPRIVRSRSPAAVRPRHMRDMPYSSAHSPQAKKL